MSIVYNGQYRLQGAPTWGALFTGIAPTQYSWATAGLAAGTYEVQVQAEDTTDGATSPWSATRTITVSHAAAAAPSLVVTEAEYAANGGAFQPLFSRLAETRYAWDTGAFGGGTTLLVRLRNRDLSDDAVSPWSATRTITVSHPIPAPVLSLPALPPMRGLSAAERTAYAAQDRTTHVWVEIQDEDGVWRDLSALAGEDFFVSVHITDSPDNPVLSAELQLFREVRDTAGTVQSLAPFMIGSALNVRSSNGTYSPLIQWGHGLRVRTAVLAPGVAPVEADKIGVFEGRLDDPDWGPDRIAVTARDYGARLQDTIVATAKSYGSEAGTALADVLRQMLADNGCADVTLCVVGDPDWFLRPFEQTAGATLYEAMQALVLQIGWDLRYRWTSRTALQLVLSQPSRTDVSALTPIYTLSPSRRLDRSWATESDGVRNIIRVAYLDAAAGEMRTVEARDADSIARFGPRVMQLAFDASSNIDTATEAQTLADTIRDDLGQPSYRVQVDERHLGALGRGDVVELTPDGAHHDSVQRAAVVSLVHEIGRTGGGDSEAVLKTTLTLRGRPMGAYRQWLNREAPPSPALGPLETTVDVVVVDATADQITYRATSSATRRGLSGTVTTGQVPQVVLRALLPGSVVLSGPAVGVPAPSGTLWTLSRPADAPGEGTWAALLPGALTGTASRAIPEVGAPVPGAPALVLRVRELSRVAGVSVTYRAEVAVPPGVTPPAALTLTASAPNVAVAISGDADANGVVTLPAPTESLATTTATADITVPLPGAPLFATTVEILVEDAALALAPYSWSTTVTDTEGMRRAMAALGAGGMPVAPTHGVLLEDFARVGAASDWTKVSGPGSIQRIGTGGKVGAGFLRAIGEVWAVGPKKSLPTAADLLLMAVGYRVDLYGTGGVPSGFFAGLVGYDINGNIVNRVGANTYVDSHYFAVAGETIAFTSGTWVRRAGWIKGTTTGTVTQGPSTNPLAPRAMHSGIVAVAPILIFNYGGPLDASSEVDYVALEAYDADAARRLYTALRDDGNLNPGVGQFDGVSVKEISKGHYQILAPHDPTKANRIAFPKTFADTPVVICTGIGGLHYQPDSTKWSPAFNAGAGQYTDIQALDLSASGFYVRALLRQRGAPTTRTGGLSPASVSSVGAAMEATLVNAPAADDTYTVTFDVDVSATIIPGGGGVTGDAYARVQVSVDSFDDAMPVGSQWTQRASRTYTISEHFDDTNSGTVSDSWSDSVSFAVSNVTSGDKVRVKIVAFDTTGGSITVSAGTVTYTTSSGDNTASMTPLAGDRVQFDVFAAGGA